MFSCAICILPQLVLCHIYIHILGVCEREVSHCILSYKCPFNVIVTRITICLFKMFILQTCFNLGVFEEVIKRAGVLLDATENNKHIQRLCNEVSDQDQMCKVFYSITYSIFQQHIFVCFAMFFFFFLIRSWK